MTLELEQELIDMIKTTGKEKNYELIEYVNDVNREYTEVLMELNINGIMDTAYSYGNERLTNERFTGWTGYYTYDPRGSVSGVTDSEGMIWQSYRYDGYGNITFGKPEYNNVYAYNAESYNPNVDVQYLRARYYCPTTADFLTEDSYLGNIIDPLTLNRYNYVKSSPLNYIDPSGHTIEDLIKQVKSTAFELNRNWNKAVYQGTKAFDSWFSNSMESIMNTARDACRTLDCEIADVTYSFTVGLVYSAVDNLIFQSGNALLELVGINSAYDSARFREDMENWMLENAVPDELGFFAGQVVGDAFMTAEMLVKLPQILETIGKNLANLTTTSSAVGYQLNPDGTIVAIEGMGFSLAEAGVLVEEFGTAGALVVASFMSATGIGNDSGKFVEALTDGESNSQRKYEVSDSRREHILEGDPPGTGHGPNRGSSEGAFPDTWTDDQVIDAIERVANNSNSTWKQATGSGYTNAPVTQGGPDPNAPLSTSSGNPVRFKVQGQDHGLNIEVIVEPGGEGIITGYVK